MIASATHTLRPALPPRHLSSNITNPGPWLRFSSKAAIRTYGCPSRQPSAVFFATFGAWPVAVSMVQTKPRLPTCNLPNSALKSNSALHDLCWSTPAKPNALSRASSAWASPSGRRGPTGAGGSHTIQIQGRVPLMLMACPLGCDPWSTCGTWLNYYHSTMQWTHSTAH